MRIYKTVGAPVVHFIRFISSRDDFTTRGVPEGDASASSACPSRANAPHRRQAAIGTGSRRVTSSLSARRKLAAVFASSATEAENKKATSKKKKKNEKRKKEKEGGKATSREWHSWCVEWVVQLPYGFALTSSTCRPQ